MHLVIAKVDKAYFDGEAASVTLPGTDGQLTILDNHMPLITSLKAGAIIVREKGKEPRPIPIESGVLEVHSSGATVIL